MHLKTLSVACATALLIAGAAHAATEKFTATLNAASETPPNDSKGTGTLTATLDTATRHFTYSVTYSGLTGPAVAAHFHGPAAPGAAAPPVVPVAKGDIAPASIKGMQDITPNQVADLEAGKWYFNIHTAAHPGGEVRGQVMKAP